MSDEQQVNPQVDSLLDPDAILRRLEDNLAERRALMILRRAALARQRILERGGADPLHPVMRHD